MLVAFHRPLNPSLTNQVHRNGIISARFTFALMSIQTKDATLDEFAKLVESGYVYTILDACDAPSVPEKARQVGEEKAISLYSGSSQQDYWAIAPYLFHATDGLLEWISETLWNEPWGIIAVSNAGLEAVRAHFRKFLVVQSPEGENWYFRFYDPRVLPVFLETCSEDETKEFFGPIQVYGVPLAGENKIRLLKAV
jgi:Domain of unknown function (DUF4123)